MQPAIKRLIDVVASAIGLVMLAPLMALVALAIRWSMGRPILFQQRRPGYHGRPFTLIKFRTMRVTDGPDAERLTRLGRFLRRSSLDELPQLWNVLKGEMSLVGPRPLLLDYLPRYTPEQARRHLVRPGITGWAQINGRNSLSWDEKFLLDTWYVDHQSTRLDLAILMATVLRVVERRGISSAGHATAPEFLPVAVQVEEATIPCPLGSSI